MAADDPRITAFFAQQSRWTDELNALRNILLDCDLTETFKWRGPCYTVGSGNVAVLWGLKDCAGLGFFKGVLLKDPHHRLVAPGDNSRSVRMFKFTSLDDIHALDETIRATVIAAAENERAGLKVDLPKDDIDYPEELIGALESDPDLQDAFDALTPGRKRGYAIYFSQPKQAATRIGRIEKMREKIFAGKGYQDR